MTFNPSQQRGHPNNRGAWLAYENSMPEADMVEVGPTVAELDAVWHQTHDLYVAAKHEMHLADAALVRATIRDEFEGATVAYVKRDREAPEWEQYRLHSVHVAGSAVFGFADDDPRVVKVNNRLERLADKYDQSRKYLHNHDDAFADVDADDNEDMLSVDLLAGGYEFTAQRATGMNFMGREALKLTRDAVGKRTAQAGTHIDQFEAERRLLADSPDFLEYLDRLHGTRRAAMDAFTGTEAWEELGDSLDSLTWSRVETAIDRAKSELM